MAKDFTGLSNLRQMARNEKKRVSYEDEQVGCVIQDRTSQLFWLFIKMTFNRM